MREARALQSELREGDEVMTTSGIYGRITELGDADAQLEIAPKLTIRIARGAIGMRVTAATETPTEE
jgi:preprotein translocase subunit YajC